MNIAAQGDYGYRLAYSLEKGEPTKALDAPTKVLVQGVSCACDITVNCEI